MFRSHTKLRGLLVFFSSICFTSILSGVEIDSKYGNIEFSTVVFKHGERSPYNIFPLNPHNESYWPQGLQQLTNNGKLEMYQLGQWYRQRYIKFLEEGYNSDTMYMRSSDIDRTIMSSDCFLAGLYPPSGSEIWNSQLLWQPIPVHSISAEVDNIISLKKPCDRYDYLLEELNQAPWYVQYYKEKEPLFKYLSKLTGYTFSEDDITGSLMNATFIIDTLELQETYNITIPPWLTPSIASELREIGLTAFYSYYSTQELTKFGNGVLLYEIVQNMIAKRNGNLRRKFEFYSGRSENLLGLLVALGVQDVQTKSVGDSIMVELRKHGGDYNVVVLEHDDTNSNEPNVLEMKKCPLPCSLDQFIIAVEDYIIYDWDKECTMYNYNVLLIIIIVIVIIVFAYGLIRYCRNSKHQYESI